MSASACTATHKMLMTDSDGQLGQTIRHFVGARGLIGRAEGLVSDAGLLIASDGRFGRTVDGQFAAVCEARKTGNDGW